MLRAVMFTGGTLNNPVLASDGTVSAPSYSFTNQTGLGFFRDSNNSLVLAAGGTNQFRFNPLNNTYTLRSSGSFSWSSTESALGAPDVFLLRDASNTLVQRNGTNSQTFRVGPATGYAIVSNTGIGYATGLGGMVTQATDKSTGVTLNKVTGEITMNAASLAANTAISFTLTNSTIAATDYIMVQHISAGTLGAYNCTAGGAAGTATINVRNLTAGALAEAIVLKFVVIKAVNS